MPAALMEKNWFGDMNNLYKDLDNKPQIKNT